MSDHLPPDDELKSYEDDPAPPVPEEAALTDSVGADPAEDVLTVGLPAGSDLDAGTPDDVVEAELTAISEGDPETAALLADEIERRRRGR